MRMFRLEVPLSSGGPAVRVAEGVEFSDSTVVVRFYGAHVTSHFTQYLENVAALEFSYVRGTQRRLIWLTSKEAV